jgi:uncharacterized membrane protein
MNHIKQSWMLLIGVAFGVFVGLPFLAPVLMEFGWKAGGNAIYFIYSFFCHQLPERSFFLFGPKLTYSLAEIQAAGRNMTDFLILRKFTGSPETGWKVAWSDRMVSLYTSIWIFGMLWRPLHRRLPKLPVWGFVLLLLPMALDGTTHFLSDLIAFGHGFRDTNMWLVTLTQNTLRPEFYAGDAWGSFNSLMRLLTGILFGWGLIWFVFPLLDQTLSEPETLVSQRS